MSGDKQMFLRSLKRGEKYDAANYRPVSLTCISCETLAELGSIACKCNRLQLQLL